MRLGFISGNTIQWLFVFIVVYCGISVFNPVWGQAEKNEKKEEEKYVLRAIPLIGDIYLDGRLDEPVWKKAKSVSNFHRQFPIDTGRADSKTQVWITYNEQYVFIAARCEGQKGYVLQSLRRDFADCCNDYFAVILDPFGDLTNGFHFYVTPQGVQREGMLANGGAYNGRSVDWDNRWFAETQIEGNTWTVEMAIPLKSLRYKSDLSSWRINFVRYNASEVERSVWARVPIQYNYATLAFTGLLKWDTAPQSQGANISLIPYVSGGWNRNYEGDNQNKFPANVGGDAKVAISSSLNLDMTINPDFSQVEVDQQITNLSRFELFFPERRQFFLENDDLFATFGFSRIRPIFTRRIGLALDTTNFLYRNVPIWGALRLSGKVDKNWRVGLLSAQTGDDSNYNIESQNFTVAAVQRQIFSRSNIAGIFVNRQGFGSRKEGNFGFQADDYNRVAGIDYNLSSKDNAWFGKVFYHRSFSPGKSAAAHASYINYNPGKFQVYWNHEFVDDNYEADAGYILRQSYWRLEPGFEYYFFPKTFVPSRHGPVVYLDIYTDKNIKTLDREITVGYQANFVSTANIAAFVNERYTRLFFPFDPTNSGAEELPNGSEYNTTTFSFEANSDLRKVFNYAISGEVGGYYNGRIHTVSNTIAYRRQPWGAISLTGTYNRIRLPDPYASADFLLLGTRIDLTFTRSLFFTTFLQYNNQINNFGINARLQWRFRPVSDLFIVYTDNYQTDAWSVRNRAIVVRLNYWLNL